MSLLSHVDITALRLYIAIVDSGSISEGALRRHMSVAAASKRITDIEKRVGVKLLHRRARGVTVNAAGAAFYDKAKAMVNIAQAMEEELNDYAQGIEDRISVMSNSSAILQFLPTDLARYLAQNPRLRIDLQELSSNRIVELLQTNQTDLGIFDKNYAVPGIPIRPYRRDTLVLITPNAHPLAAAERIRFRDTLKYDYVGLYDATSLSHQMEKSASELGRLLRVRIQVNSFDAVCRMVEGGIGIGIVPTRAVSAYLHLGALQKVDLDEDWAHRQLVLGWPAQRHLSLGAANLIEHLGSAEA